MLIKCLLDVSLQPGKKKQRAQVIEFFIDVARECFNIGNFNSLMAIICECLVSQSHTGHTPQGAPHTHTHTHSRHDLDITLLQLPWFPPTAGMNMSPVSRLKKTWGKAKTAKFFILEVGLH